MSLTALLFALMVPAVTEPIDAAVQGLVAEIEDDKGPDSMMQSMETKGCETRIIGVDREWRIDWHIVDMVAPEDTFVYVSAPSLSLAIVGDASKPDQAAKLAALFTAMTDKARACQPLEHTEA